MNFSIERLGGKTVVDVDGELTVNNRGEFKERILALVAEGDTDVIIDFTKTGYIDSGGLGVLVSLSKRISDQDGRLTLAGLNQDLRLLFEWTHIHTEFQFADSRASALGDS